MKSTLYAVFIVALLPVLEGCKKAQPQTAVQDRYGIGIEWPRLDSDFHDSDPAVQAAVASIKRSILYHQFAQAIAGLDRLASNSSLSDSQKKTVNDVRDQTQQVMTKAASVQPAQ
jgi:hypothetical protein